MHTSELIHRRKTAYSERNGLGLCIQEPRMRFLRKGQDGRNNGFSFCSDSSPLDLVHRDLISCLPVSVLLDFAMACPSILHFTICWHT